MLGWSIFDNDESSIHLKEVETNTLACKASRQKQRVRLVMLLSGTYISRARNTEHREMGSVRRKARRGRRDGMYDFLLFRQIPWIRASGNE